MAGRLSFSGKLLLVAVGIGAFAATVIIGFVDAPQIRAQSIPATDARLPSFEVASVKPNHSVVTRPVVWFRPGRLTVTGATLKLLIPIAYHIEDYQVSGGPTWINSERYDIEAKEPDVVTQELQRLPPDQRYERGRLLLRSLLSDRFMLRVSDTTKELPIFALVVAKKGPKIQEAKPGDPYSNGIKGPDGVATRGMMRLRPGEFTAQAIPIASLVTMLTQLLSRTIQDRTALKGNYDVHLQWNPDLSTTEIFQSPSVASPGVDTVPAPDSSGLSIFTAIQEQLGLKLESTKGPVEVLVIDHIERPSEN